MMTDEVLGRGINIEDELGFSHSVLCQQTGESGQHDVVLSNIQDIQVGQPRLVLGLTRLQDDHPAVRGSGRSQNVKHGYSGV